MTDDIEPGAKGIRILIADDHPLIRAGMRTCLAAHPDWHVCAEADNGEAALQLARAHRPDVVVLDVSLPLCNGLEVTRSLCRQFPGLGVVIYTMHEEQQLLMDLLKAGARGWVSKNEDDVVLLEAISAVAEGRTFVGRATGAGFSSVPAPAPNASMQPLLTPREREVVKLVAEGATNRSIATRLNVSIKTVDSHRMAAMRKLDVHTVAEIVRYAIREQLIQP